MFEIPNPKVQIPGKTQSQNSKSQRTAFSCPWQIWSLKFAWDLVPGISRFYLSPLSRRSRAFHLTLSLGITHKCAQGEWKSSFAGRIKARRIVR